MKFILNILRVAPQTKPHRNCKRRPRRFRQLFHATPTPVAVAKPRPARRLKVRQPELSQLRPMRRRRQVAPTSTLAATSPPSVAIVSPSAKEQKAVKEPEVRRAEPVKRKNLAKAGATETSSAAASGERIVSRSGRCGDLH